MAAFAIAVGALAACESPFQPTPNAPVRIVLHSVLDLGVSSQFLLLERTEPDVNGYGVHGARVDLITPQGQAIRWIEVLQDNASGPAAYAAEPPTLPRLNPGATYRLQIITREGDTVTGATTVPNANPVAGPSIIRQFNRLTDTLRLAWPRIAGARSYQVSVFSLVTGDASSVNRFVFSVFADTSITLPGTMRTIENNPVFVTGGRFRVVVVAVDDNYYTFYHAQVDPFAGAPPSRLTGALGVFGSAVPLIQRLYDVR